MEQNEEAPEGTYIFDHQRSNQGYALNKMCMSLTKAENREQFSTDPTAYMHSYNVPEDQIDAVDRRDWLSLTKSGGNVYMLLKLGHLLGVELWAIGAQQRGETLEKFLETRMVKDAR